MRRSIIVVLGLLGATAAAQPPSLVADINQQPVPVSSNPNEAVALGSRVFFAATTKAIGTELYSSSGVPGNLQLIKDIDPGPGSGNPFNLVEVGGQLFFRADDGVSGSELWVTNGSAAGTSMIELTPGPSSTLVEALTAFGSRLFFRQDRLTSSDSIHLTDGTVAGTVKLADVWMLKDEAIVFGNTVVFQNNDGTHGFELWKTDGTPGGTSMIIDLNPGGNGYDDNGEQDWAVFGGMLYFRGDDGVRGFELWRTDGTAGGTQIVSDIFPGPQSSSPERMVVAGSTLFFEASDGVSGRELWATDGTSGGTRLVRDIWPGPFGVGIQAPVALGSVLIFAADDGANGEEPWVSDGMTLGTLMLRDIGAGGRSSRPRHLTVFGQEVFFAADDYPLAQRVELWKTDGTPGGTALVANINPKPNGSSWPHDLVALGSRLVFGADDGANGDELWHSNGTAPGTGLVLNLATPTQTSSSGPEHLVDVDGTLIFSANDGVRGQELWKTDGTAPGTQLIADLIPGGSSQPQNLTRVGNLVFFTTLAPVPGVGEELWRTDGTTAGTLMVRDINPGSGSAFVAMIGALDDELYFSAYEPSSGRELWKSDGTQAGTILVADIHPGSGPSNPSRGLVLDQLLYFAAGDGTSGRELWRTNGTATGTQLVSDINPGPGSSSPARLTQLEDRMYFFADDGVRGTELWESDGTSGGTQLLKEILPGPQSGTLLVDLVRAGPFLYFQGLTSASTLELWRTNGTASGTVNVNPSFTDSPDELTAVGDELFFAATHFVSFWPQLSSGRELWKTNGLSSGTTLAADIASGPSSSDPQHLTATGSRFVYFSTSFLSADHLYVSDGTAVGTRRLATYSSSFHRRPRYFTLSSGELLFAADDGQTGVELWKLDPGANVQDLGPGCSQDGFPPQLDVTDPALGSLVRFDVRGAEASVSGAVWFGFSGSPVFVGWNCHFYFPLNFIIEIGRLVPNSAGRGSLSFVMPIDPALIGGQFTAQAFQWYAINPYGIDYSNGKRLTVGL